MEDFVARRTKTAESKIALAEAQALADVRAAAADAAVTAASTILSQSVKGPVADDLLAKGIDEVRAKAELTSDVDHPRKPGDSQSFRALVDLELEMPPAYWVAAVAGDDVVVVDALPSSSPPSASARASAPADRSRYRRRRNR